MHPIKTIRSKTALLPRADVDTDQIIPARFLTTTSRDGLGKSLFADWRYLENGNDNPDFELNQPHNRGATVLVAGRNFGCGSSREHAPWALTDYGFQAVISTEIADIFRSNSLKNGLLPIVVDTPFHAELMAEQHDVLIDLETCAIAILDGGEPARETRFDIDSFARFCLMQGTDQLGFLTDKLADIEAFELQHERTHPA